MVEGASMTHEQFDMLEMLSLASKKGADREREACALLVEKLAAEGVSWADIITAIRDRGDEQ